MNFLVAALELNTYPDEKLIMIGKEDNWFLFSTSSHKLISKSYTQPHVFQQKRFWMNSRFNVSGDILVENSWANASTLHFLNTLQIWENAWTPYIG